MKEKILLVILAAETFLLAIAVYGLKIRIDDLEQRNLEVHEHILNMIEGRELNK